MFVLAVAATTATTAASPTVMGMVMAMFVVMVIMVMAVGVIMMMVMIVATAAMGVDMGGLFRIERPLEFLGAAPLTANEVLKNEVAFHIERVGGRLDRPVQAPELPGEAHEAQRVFRRNLVEQFIGSLHKDEPPILQLEGIPIPQIGGFFRRITGNEAAFGMELQSLKLAGLMVENNLVSDLISLDGGFTNDAYSAEHCSFLK